jgi:hypothetical protein
LEKSNMKRAMIVGTSLLAFAVFSFAQTAEVTRVVNLREKPNVASKIIQKLVPGRRLKLLNPASAGGYYRVELAPGENGFVWSRNVAILPAHAETQLQKDAGPVPLLASGHPVDWWFVFKFNSAIFPGCGDSSSRSCIFGGTPQAYAAYSQQFVYASSENHKLQQGKECLGDTTNDPVGSTFAQIYTGAVYYAIWNDQFYDDPQIQGCTTSCGAPWGHSKGILAWNEVGQGLVMQVTTPSWPAAGSVKHPRGADGNTLGCVKDNDVQVSQHFFALKLTKADLLKVLAALGNASVVTDPSNPQIVKNGGPAEVQSAVAQLGIRSTSKQFTRDTLSTGIVLLSKPSRLNVPPWQFVSAVLGGGSFRTATWWASPKIYTTTSSTTIGCWDPTLPRPGPVDIAIGGRWAGKEFALTGGPGRNSNHAKIGVSMSGPHDYSVFGDMNQQGTTSGPTCASSQNGRGGLFYVIEDRGLTESIRGLIQGASATTAPQ